MDENKRYVVLVAILVIVMAGLIFLQGSHSGTPALPGSNSSPTPTPAYTPNASRFASQGDTVFVDYTLTVENGTVYDTSIESVARAAGLYRADLEYNPLEFTIGSGQVITGFEAAVLSMAEGSERNASIPAAQAYGEYDPTRIAVMVRNYSTGRIESVNMSSFMAAFPNFSFSENTTIRLGSWEAEIIAVTSTYVMLMHNPEINKTIETGSWQEVVTGLNDTSIMLRRNPINGSSYYVRGPDGTPQVGRVIDIQDDYFVLDYNHPLAGQALNFTLKLVRIQ